MAELNDLNPWVEHAAEYVNTVAVSTNASAGSVVSEIKRLSKEYESDFDACYDALGPPSFLHPGDKVKTLRQIATKLRESRRHNAKHCDVLLDIINGAGQSAEEKLCHLAESLRRSKAQLDNSQRAGEQDAEGMCIKGMDDIVAKWLLRKSPEDRTVYIERLVKDHSETLSKETRGAKRHLGGFIATCMEGAKNLEEAGIKNIIYSVADAAKTNIEFLKANKAMEDIIDNFTKNAHAKGPTGYRHNETLMEFGESVKHNSNFRTTEMTMTNLGGPTVRSIQERLRRSRESTSKAGVDEETLKHIATHHRHEVWSVGIDETKLKTVSIGDEGESDYGDQYGHFGLKERQAYLKKRLDQASMIAADGSDTAIILQRLKEMEEILKADEKVIRYVWNCAAPLSRIHTIVMVRARS